jgi:hypothetical protein
MVPDPQSRREGLFIAPPVRAYPPAQKTTCVSPWMNARDGPTVALAKAGASADSAEEMKDTTGVSPGRLHSFPGLTGICFLFYREIRGNLASL